MISATVDKASWMRNGDGFWVSFRIRESQVGGELCRLMADGKPRELTVRQKKRSLNANAYAWTLIGKLAAKLRSTPEEVYRRFITDVGDNCEWLSMPEAAVKVFTEAWGAGHIGRIAEDMGPDRSRPGCRNVRFYYGSSDYDRAQMARLIDLIVEECKAQGIDTLTERERSLLVEKWGER